MAPSDAFRIPLLLQLLCALLFPISVHLYRRWLGTVRQLWRHVIPWISARILHTAIQPPRSVGSDSAYDWLLCAVLLILAASAAVNKRHGSQIAAKMSGFQRNADFVSETLAYAKMSGSSYTG